MKSSMKNCSPGLLTTCPESYGLRPGKFQLNLLQTLHQSWREITSYRTLAPPPEVVHLQKVSQRRQQYTQADCRPIHLYDVSLHFAWELNIAKWTLFSNQYPNMQQIHHTYSFSSRQFAFFSFNFSNSTFFQRSKQQIAEDTQVHLRKFFFSLLSSYFPGTLFSSSFCF